MAAISTGKVGPEVVDRNMAIRETFFNHILSFIYRIFIRILITLQ